MTDRCPNLRCKDGKVAVGEAAGRPVTVDCAFCGKKPRNFNRAIVAVLPGADDRLLCWKGPALQSLIDEDGFKPEADELGFGLSTEDQKENGFGLFVVTATDGAYTTFSEGRPDGTEFDFKNTEVRRLTADELSALSAGEFHRIHTQLWGEIASLWDEEGA
jgi:hypothetical protein